MAKASKTNDRDLSSNLLKRVQQPMLQLYTNRIQGDLLSSYIG